MQKTLLWRHNDHDGVSNHQPHGCLLNRLFRRWSRKTSKLRVTGLCEGYSPVTGEFPAQGPVTRKMFPFVDVIMIANINMKNDIYWIIGAFLFFIKLSSSCVIATRSNIRCAENLSTGARSSNVQMMSNSNLTRFKKFQDNTTDLTRPSITW